MKKARLLLIIILFSFASYCSGHYVEYKITLKNVDYVHTPDNDLGEKKIVLFQEKDELKSAYENEMIKIVWTPTPYRFLFAITNKTQHSMKIVWKEAEYIDQNGVAKKIMQSAVGLSERNGYHLPITVASGSTVKGFVFPADSLYWVSGDRGGWRQDPLFPYFNRTSAEDLMVEVKEYKGKSVQVLLPFDVQNSIYNYRFTFKISDVVLKE
jgi:hypothetical protein